LLPFGPRGVGWGEKGGWDAVVGTVDHSTEKRTRYSSSGARKNFCLLQKVQTNHVAHPASRSVDVGRRAAGTRSWPLTPIWVLQTRMGPAIHSLTYMLAFMALCYTHGSCIFYLGLCVYLIIVSLSLVFCYHLEQCFLVFLLADPSWLWKITTEPHIFTYVNTGCPDKKYPKLKICISELIMYMLCLQSTFPDWHKEINE
jgi:hypothetical protein